MQYNMYPHDPRAAQHSGHPHRQPSHPPSSFVPGYADHHHHQHQHQHQQQYQPVAAAPYSTLAPSMTSGMMGNHSSNVLHSLAYSPYAAHGSTVMSDDPRYFSSHPGALEQYAAPHSPTSSYASSPSPVMNPQSPSQAQHFIPTPSQTYQVYSSSSLTPPQRPRATADPYYTPSTHHQHASQSASSSSHSANTRPTMTCGSLPSHSANHTSSSVACGDRYPCDLCDRSFTRLHDRRRHYETVHATSPVIHKCQYCRKDFSRADSLKRHVDNGCDEKPRQSDR